MRHTLRDEPFVVKRQMYDTLRSKGTSEYERRLYNAIFVRSNTGGPSSSAGTKGSIDNFDTIPSDGTAQDVSVDPNSTRKGSSLKSNNSEQRRNDGSNGRHNMSHDNIENFDQGFKDNEDVANTSSSSSSQ